MHQSKIKHCLFVVLLLVQDSKSTNDEEKPCLIIVPDVGIQNHSTIQDQRPKKELESW